MKFGRFFKLTIGAVFLIVCAMVSMGYVAQMCGFDLPLFSWFMLDGGKGVTFMLGVATVAPWPVDPEQTAVAIAYHNSMYIADNVLPRKPVGRQNFKYRNYAKGTFLTIPETIVGRTGKPNQVEIGFTEEDSSTVDHALDDPIPYADIENAPPGYNPISAATEFVTDLIELDREKRVADTVFNADNFATANKATLSGSSQFSHADSTPITTIQNAIDACFFRPNKVVMGRAVWTALSKHADIVSATQKNSGTMGLASRRAFGDLFELDEVLVGEGWYNTAKPGQTPVVARLWGKSFLLFYSNPVADINRGVTFGLTAQWGSRISGTIKDDDMGMRGGARQRVGESVKELILASDLGYLMSAAVA